MVVSSILFVLFSFDTLDDSLIVLLFCRSTKCRTFLHSEFGNFINRNEIDWIFSEFWPPIGPPIISPFLERTQPANLCMSES